MRRRHFFFGPSITFGLFFIESSNANTSRLLVTKPKTRRGGSISSIDSSASFYRRVFLFVFRADGAAGRFPAPFVLFCFVFCVFFFRFEPFHRVNRTVTEFPTRRPANERAGFAVNPPPTHPISDRSASILRRSFHGFDRSRSFKSSVFNCVLPNLETTRKTTGRRRWRNVWEARFPRENTSSDYDSISTND